MQPEMFDALLCRIPRDLSLQLLSLASYENNFRQQAELGE